jgi:hypothetical protein
MGDGGYVSTTNGVLSQPFAILPDTPNRKRDSRIFTQFFIDIENALQWLNSAFANGQAIFCVFSPTVLVVFDGVVFPGCEVIQLGAIPATDVNQLPSSSTTALQSPATNVMSTGSLMTNPPISAFTTPASTQPAPFTTTPAGPPNQSTPNSGPSSSLGGSSLSTSGTAYPAPTSTGAPNCFDRSSFDGTVNDNYLILCNTDLPGYDLEVVPASDIGACRDACNAYVPSAQGPCVAVAFDHVSHKFPKLIPS